VGGRRRKEQAGKKGIKRVRRGSRLEETEKPVKDEERKTGFRKRQEYIPLYKNNKCSNVHNGEMIN